MVRWDKALTGVKRVLLHAAAWGAVALVAYLAIGGFRLGTGPRRQSGRSTSDRHDTGDDSGAHAWPHLRGPAYSGVSRETGLADAWPDEGPPVLWIRDLGPGYSGFSAVGGRVWTQTQTAYFQAVLCLDADSGQTIWEHRYGWPYDSAGMYPGPRATPTWHDGRVYFAGPRGLIGCLRAGDGKPLWSLNVNEQFGGQGTEFGYSASPVVADGKVFLPVGGEGASVVALDAATGQTVWSTGDEPASYCSVLPIDFRGRRHVVALLQNALASFELASGRLLWQNKFSRGYDEHAAMPLYDEPYLFVAGAFRSGADLLEITTVETTETKDGETSGTEQLAANRVWASPEMSNDVASSVLVDGYVYGFDLKDIQTKARRRSRGKFKCLDLATGEVAWATDRTGHAAVIAAAGKLLLLNDAGEILLVRATPDAYEEMGRTDVFGGELCWTAPSLSRGRLFLRSPTRAACLYVGRPDRLDPGRLAQATPAEEIPQPKRLDLAWLAGGEREYPADAPEPGELLLWYGVSLAGPLGIAALLAAAVWQLLRRKWPVAGPWWGRAVFWTAAFGLGFAATPIANHLVRPFIFTWPLALAVAHQAMLATVVWAHRHGRKGLAAWPAFAAAVGFFGVLLAYFDLCNRLDLAMLWVFLIGFLPSWPVAVPAAYKLARPGHPLGDALWTAASFTAYFWATGAYVLVWLC